MTNPLIMAANSAAALIRHQNQRSTRTKPGPVPIAMTKQTLTALKDSPLKAAAKQRSKNFYALGVLYWLYSRPLEATENWIRAKFGAKQEVLDAIAVDVAVTQKPKAVDVSTEIAEATAAIVEEQMDAPIKATGNHRIQVTVAVEIDKGCCRRIACDGGVDGEIPGAIVFEDPSLRSPNEQVRVSIAVHISREK